MSSLERMSTRIAAAEALRAAEADARRAAERMATRRVADADTRATSIQDTAGLRAHLLDTMHKSVRNNSHLSWFCRTVYYV